MGILKPGQKIIIMQGRDFGKKVVISKIENNFVYYKINNKEQKINILHVFPINE
ncbi:MAG TPA: hypothetical protein PKK56_01545 [archaeon]|nr:hypothetical protein [archaeon]HPC10092.1 hypothetical protein [archaeon]HRT02335.1 hypothetical protein [Candidatus Diapherotrites archaeon]